VDYIMKNAKKRIMILQALFLVLTALQMTSCDSGLEIVGLEIVQYPSRTEYPVEFNEELDMYGCIILIRTRDGHERKALFVDTSWATISHEIDFSLPGEHEVFIYWGDVQRIGSFTVQVVPSDS